MDTFGQPLFRNEREQTGERRLYNLSVGDEYLPHPHSSSLIRSGSFQSDVVRVLGSRQAHLCTQSYNIQE